MRNHQASFRLALFFTLGLVGLSTACSPRHTVNKYSYWIKQAEALPGSSTNAASMASASGGYLPVGHLSTLNGGRAMQENFLVVETAKSYLGTPYQSGGMSRLGMDCSGLICVAYQSINKGMPRTSQAMLHLGVPLNQYEVLAGDLVFFDSKGGKDINHVGLVVEGRGERAKFIHSTLGQGVRMDALDDPYWKTRFRQGVRP